MVRFETIESKDVKLGGNNFLEIAHKKAITSDGENEFISISRGFVTRENEKRFKTYQRNCQKEEGCPKKIRNFSSNHRFCGFSLWSLPFSKVRYFRYTQAKASISCSQACVPPTFWC